MGVHMKQSLFKKLLCITIALLIFISQIQVVIAKSEEKDIGINTVKNLTLPNPEVYPEFYKKKGEDTNKLEFAPSMSNALKSSTPSYAKSMVLPSGSVEKVLAIPFAFTNKALSKDNTQLEDKLNGLKDYYEKNSKYSATNGMSLDITVTNPVISIHTMEYYGADTYTAGYYIDDTHVSISEMAREAIKLLDSHGFDFTPYDKNHDGEIDHLIIIHAGSGQEAVNNSALNLIWSHWSKIGNVHEMGQAVDGINAINYLAIAEDSELGTIAHEFGHDIGLPDLYDTDGAYGGETEGVGDWDVMGSGSWNKLPGQPGGSCPANLSAWSRMQLGWLYPTSITSDGTYTLYNSDGNSEALRFWTDGNVNGNEYYLSEYRRKIGYDAGLPGEGLLIWHIDKQQIDETIEENYINANDNRLGIELEQADGNWDLWYGNNRGDAGDPFPGSSSNYNFVGVPDRFNFSNIDSNQYSYVELKNINVSESALSAEYYVMKNPPTVAPILGETTSGSAITITPTFSWELAPKVMEYVLQIAEDNTFLSNLKEFDLSSSSDGVRYNGTGYSFTLPPTEALIGGKTYYWRVAGVNSLSDNRSLVWSQQKSFYTEYRPDDPGSTTPSAITFSFDGSNAGKLMGITNTMEYSLDGGLYYTAALSDDKQLSTQEISSIYAAKDIKVRAKATEHEISGSVQTVDILNTSTPPIVSSDDSNNSINGISNAMEFSLDSINWIKYNYNLPGLSGDTTIWVRTAASGVSVPSASVQLNFTAAIPAQNPNGPENGNPPSGGGGFIPFFPPTTGADLTPPVAENPIDVIQKDKPVDISQANKIADYIGTLSDELNRNNSTDSEKAADINNAAGKIDDIAKIIGNTTDAQAAAKIVSETTYLIAAIVDVNDSIKGEANAIKALEGLNTAIQSSAGLLNAIKTKTDKKNIEAKVIDLLESENKTLDKIDSPEKVLEAAQNVIKNVSGIITANKKGIFIEEVTTKVNSMVDKTIEKLGTSEKQAKLVGNAAEVNITDIEVQELLAKADVVLAVAKKLEKELLDSKIKNNFETKVVITIPKAKRTKSINTTLPSDLMSTLLLKGLDKVEISTGIATISIAPDAIKTDGTGSISLQVKQADKFKDLTPEQRSIAGNNTVFDLNAWLISINGKQSKVSQFSKDLEISIPYILAPKQDPAKITVFFINDKGILENQNGKYDPDTETVVFKTNHFSKYMIKENNIAFSDLAKYKDYVKYIEAVAVNGIMKAKTGDKFMPTDVVTRGELADILVKLFKLGDTSDKSLKANFLDVKAGSTYYGAIALVNKVGLMNGSGKNFNPDAKITRQDLAVVLAKGLKTYKGISLTDDTQKYLNFTDISKVNPTSKNSIAVMVKYGLMEAKTGKLFIPAGTINRAEIAKVFYFIMNLK